MKKKSSIFLIFIFIFTSAAGFCQNVKECEFAGSFYPNEKEALSALLDDFFVNVDTSCAAGEIIGLISPHAGYVYSGPIAAAGFKCLEKGKFDTVILLAPSHRYGFRGISVYPRGKFSTPLGDLNVDHRLTKEFKSLEFAQFEEKYFSGEHSLEVQLPFIIKVLGGPKIVPIIFGEVVYEDLEKIAQKLAELARKGGVLVIVSTDLSHFLTYAEAVDMDTRTVELIKHKDASFLWFSKSLGEGRACGIAPVITFLIYAKLQGADIEIIKYANSGDTAGDKSKVVGYLSAAAYKNRGQKTEDRGQKTEDRNQKAEDRRQRTEDRNQRVEPVKEESMGYSLNKEEKISLLKIARTTLESFLKNGSRLSFTAATENLKAERGAFVTLKKDGQLRGCIGRIVGDTPVYKVVSDFAVYAATEDNRFPPVTYEELGDIEIEISVLTPFEEVKSLDEIEVGKHGLMMKKGSYSGLLLPQVPTEYGWDKKTFLEHTCIKAGLAPSAYKDKDTFIWKFSAIVFNESDFSAK